LSADVELPKMGMLLTAGTVRAGVSEAAGVVSGGGLAGGAKPELVSPNDRFAGVFGVHAVPGFAPNDPGPALPLSCAPQCGQTGPRLSEPPHPEHACGPPIGDIPPNPPYVPACGCHGDAGRLGRGGVRCGSRPNWA
jgi:hypothetical protein